MNPGGDGLFASARNLAAALVAAARTRIELLATEIAVEKERALRQFVLAQLVVFFLGLAVVCGMLLLLSIFEARRELVAGLLALVFLVCAGLCWRGMVNAGRRGGPPLADTLAELQEDLRRLKALSGHDQQTGG